MNTENFAMNSVTNCASGNYVQVQAATQFGTKVKLPPILVLQWPWPFSLCGLTSFLSSDVHPVTCLACTADMGTRI